MWLHILPEYPSKPYTAHKVPGKPFRNICPCANVIGYTRFEDVRTFLYVFMSELKFCALEIMGECTSRRLFSYGGFQFMFQLEELLTLL